MSEISDNIDSINEAIQLILASAGFETDDSEIIMWVREAMAKRIEDISTAAKHQTGSSDNNSSITLDLPQLQKALNSLKPSVKINRPDFIQEQTQNRRRKPTK